MCNLWASCDIGSLIGFTQTKRKVNQKIEMKLEVQIYDEGNAYSLFNMHSYHPITKDC